MRPTISCLMPMLYSWSVFMYIVPCFWDLLVSECKLNIWIDSLTGLEEPQAGSSTVQSRSAENLPGRRSKLDRFASGVRRVLHLRGRQSQSACMT